MTISVYNLLTLFFSMLLLAAIPSTSVLVVTSRAATCGFKHGVILTLGIIFGDIIFILTALLGLSYIAQTLSAASKFIQLFAGLYLIGFGISMLRPKPNTNTSTSPTTFADASFSTSFFTGLFMTLADLKAITFYLGFLPAFINLKQANTIDITLIILAAAIALSSTKIFYAYLATHRKLKLHRSKLGTLLIKIAAIVLIIIGGTLTLSTMNQWLNT